MRWHYPVLRCPRYSRSVWPKSPFRQASGAVKSINQNVHRDALPDFRNLGVILRVVLIVLGAVRCSSRIAEVGSWSELQCHASWRSPRRSQPIADPEHPGAVRG